jgi:hypothetical protein
LLNTQRFEVVSCGGLKIGVSARDKAVELAKQLNSLRSLHSSTRQLPSAGGGE